MVTARKTDADLVVLLKRAVACSGSMVEWARRHDFTRSFVCDVLAGRRPVTERLAAALGYQPARLWEPREKG